MRLVSIISGIFLIVIGFLLVFDYLSVLSQYLNMWLPQTG
jgi:hypothetical protein